MKKILIALIATLAAFSPVYAGNVTGLVDSLLIGRNGHEAYINIVGTPSNFPCASNGTHPSYQYAISLNNTGGKEMLATLQAAKLTDTEVQVVGSTQCAAFDNKLELVGYVVQN